MSNGNRGRGKRKVKILINSNYSQLMKFIFFISLIIVLNSCSLDSIGVKYIEMKTPPKVKINGDTMFVNVSNSTLNSSMKIHKVEFYTKENNIIVIKGHQSAFGKLKSQYFFILSNYNIENISEYKIYWEDPNFELHKIR